jgi:Domain of unknown function (DUF3395)
MKRLSTALIAAFLMVSAMLGQYGGEGRWSIVRAEFGAGHTWSDVTAQVKALIHGDSLNFEVRRQVLGTDPVPGKTKTLRLQVQNWRGESRTLTFQEHETVNLQVISDAAVDSWGRASWGGGLRILKADYGVGNRFVDVTARLSSQVQGDQLSLRVTNSTMGRDPAEEHAKTLTVWYSYHGRAARAVVNEKDYLMLPSNNPYYADRLVVMRAQYGADYRFHDVTDLLNARIQDDHLQLRITNDTMGGDPAEDRPKTLSVSYLYEGHPGRVVVKEKDYLDLPGAVSGGLESERGDLQILWAGYGTGDRRREVTDLVASQMRGDQLDMPVSDWTMGGDPAPGLPKTLKVIYLWQGLRYETNVPERGTLDLP